MTYTKPVCRGSLALGNACGKCERCKEEHLEMTSRLNPASPFSKPSPGFLKAISDTIAPRWECFSDPAYYDLWAVRREGGAFTETMHLHNKDEAEWLTKHLNDMDAKLAAASVEYGFRCNQCGIEMATKPASPGLQQLLDSTRTRCMFCGKPGGHGEGMPCPQTAPLSCNSEKVDG